MPTTWDRRQCAEEGAGFFRSADGTLLEERDAYIAGRIDSTLAEGETGLLFMGMAHKVVRRLPRDVTVIPLAGLRSVTGDV